MYSIAVLVGSLRRDSINKKLAHALVKLGAGKLEFRFVEIGDLPLYNEDLWADPPPSIARFKQAVEAADGVLLVSPEYNRGIPGVLKNAIDWGSRPYGKSSWTGKPVGLAGTSMGAIGTAVAQASLRHTMIILDTAVMGLPEVYLTYKEGLIDAEYNVTDESTRKRLTKYVERFAAWVEKQKQ
ncbi:MAG: NADPH-dependent FMN reductase [Steroidobacteraceae bacterium]